MKTFYFPASKTTKELEAEIALVNGPKEVILQDEHASRENCVIPTPAGISDIIYRGDVDNRSTFISSYTDKDTGWDAWENLPGVNVYTKVIRYNGGPNRHFMWADAGTLNFEYMQMKNQMSADFEFYADTNLIRCNGARLDMFQPGDVVSLDAPLNNGNYTVTEILVDGDVQNMRVAEPLVDEYKPGGFINIRLADERLLKNGEYIMIYQSLGKGYSTLYVGADDIDAKRIHFPFGSPIYHPWDGANNITYRDFDIINSRGTLKNCTNVLVEDINFKFGHGKQIWIDESCKGVTVNRCNVYGGIEGFYTVASPQDFVEDVTVSNCLFEDLNYLNPNHTPAKDGHSVGFMSGRNQIAEYCQSYRTQGVAYAYYSWASIPDIGDNNGFRNIHVDTVKEYVPGTIYSVQGIAMNGDYKLIAGTQTNQFIKNCVVKGVRAPTNHTSKGVGIRFKTPDSGSEDTDMEIHDNFAIDCDIGIYELTTLEKPRIDVRRNTTIGCDVNIQFSNAVPAIDLIKADYNRYDSAGEYVLEQYNRIIDFPEYQEQALIELHPDGNESNSIEMTPEQLVQAEVKANELIDIIKNGGILTLTCEEQLASANTAITTLQSEVNNLNNTVNILTTEKSGLEIQVTNLNDQLTTANSDLAAVQADLASTHLMLSAAETTRDHYLSLLNQLEQILQSK